MRHLAATTQYRLPLHAALTALTAVLLCVQSVSAVDDYSQWGNWTFVYVITKTTPPGANVTNTQTNFPVLVRVNPTISNLSNAADDGSDVRFSNADGSSHLYYQMERWKHTSPTIDTGEFWVLVPSVAGNDTTKLRMYWNKSGAVDSSNGSIVFNYDSYNFVTVYHLEETPPTMTDASSMGNTGTAQNSATSIPGIIGNGLSLNGSSQYISTSIGVPVNPNNNTISAWFKTTTTNGGKIIGLGSSQTGSSTYYDRHIYMGNSGKLYFGVYNGSDAVDSTSTTYKDGNWHYVAGTFSGSGLVLYVDGVQAMTQGGVTPNDFTPRYWRMGYDNLNSWPSAPSSYYFNGSLDEPVISNTTRSADWIKLCYQNQRLTNGRDSLTWFSSSYSNNYTWDLTTASGILAGSGTWGTNSYWTPDGNGTILFAWPGGGSSATFAGADGSYTITINGTQNVDSVAFLSDGYTLSGGTAVDFGSGGSILVANSKTAVFSTPITTTGGLIKYGPGTLTLSGTNTYTSPTTISAGTLSIGAGSTTGAISNSSDVTDNATLIFNRSNAYTYSGTISGSGAVIKNGTGTTTLSANNSYTGLTTVNAGTLSLTGAPTSNALKYVINTGGTISVADRLNLSPVPAVFTADWVTINGGTLSTAILTGNNYGPNRGFTLGASGGTIDIPNTYNSNAVEIQGVITGTGALIKTGVGTLQLSGTNNYSGTTTISAGTLSIGAGGGTGAISNSSNVTDNATLQFYRTGTYTYTGAITGSGAVIQAGSGTVNLSSTSNAWGGATTISAGTLQLGNNGIIPDGSAVSLANVSATTFDLNSYAETVGSISGGGGTGGNITLGSGTLTCGGDNSNTTYSGVISGTGGLTKAGSGTLTLSGTSTYTGVTTFNAGTVAITSLANGGANSNIGAAANTADKLVINGGTLSYGGGAQSCDRLFTLGTSAGSTIVSSGSGALNLTGTGALAFSGAGTRTLTLGGTQTGDNTFAAVIGNNGGNATSITKTGAGKWILSNANTCNGAVSVSNGTLLVTNTSGSGTGTGAVTVSSGGTLGGSGSIGGAVSVSSGGTIAPGTTVTGTLTINSNLTLVSGAVVAINLNGTVAGTNYDQLAVNGTANLASATLTITLGYIPNTGDVYTILPATSLSGTTFHNLAEGATDTIGYNGNLYKFTISYAGNNVVLTAAGLASEDYSTWLYSQKIFINTSPGGAGLSSTASPIHNFPLLVRLDSTRFFHFYQTAAGGADIRFANSRGVPLNYDMERWKDNTGDNDSAAIWVLVDSIAPNSWSNYITMYWGNPSASSDADSTKVFATSNNYSSVLHLKETANNAGNGYRDATANAKNGTGYNFAGNESVAGVCGNAISMNGSNQYIDVGSVGISGTASRSIEGWVKGNENTNWTAAFGFTPNSTTGGTYFDVESNGSNNYTLHFYNTDYPSSVPTTDNTWHHFAATFNGTNAYIYVDGQQKNTGNPTLNTTDAFRIGYRQQDGNYFLGIFDEVRVSNTARSADWIKLCYQTQKLACDTIVDIENYADWPFSQTITVNTSSTGANISGNVTNFPMLVRLNPSNFGGFAQTSPSHDGRDIRFANSKGLHLPYEKERWSYVSGDLDTAEFWVLLDTVFGNNATQTFTMYWGKAGAATRSSPATVFDTANGFAGVWHLKETSGNAADATINGISGTTHSGVNYSKGGGVGLCDSVDGTNNGYFDMGTNAAFNMHTNKKLTISAWVNHGNAAMGTTEGIAGRWNWSGGNWREFILSGTSGTPKFTISTDGQDGTSTALNAASGITNGTWYYLAGVMDGTNMYMYINNVSTSVGKNDVYYTASGNTLVGTLGVNQGQNWNGNIDEVRIERTNRSDDWVKLCYATQKPLSQAAVTENYATWPYSQKIYLNTTGFSGSNISTGLGSFPILVRLDTTNFRNFSQTLAGGADIRFANSSGAHLYYEIERWKDNAANNDTAVIWVKVDTILPINGTQYINMYWGKAGAASLSNGPMVFGTSNNYNTVLHLKETANNSGNGYSDATANANAGTGYNFAGNESVAGMCGNGISLNGSNQYIDLGSVGISGSASRSIEGWVKGNENTNWCTAFGFSPNFNTDNLYFDIESSASNIYTLHFHGSDYPTGVSTTDNIWHHFAATFNGTTAYVFVDGVQKNSATPTLNTTDLFRIGWRQNFGGYFQGIFDEVRISNTNRSADWIKLCYQNQQTNQTLCDYEDYSTWRSSRRVGINTGAGGISLTGPVNNFPLLVRLDASNFDFSEANGSTDVRFARSDGTHLLYETERWDSTNKAAELWVLVDTVKSSNAAQYVTMYWGKNGVFSKSNPARVFDTANGFQGAWHLSESSGSAVDATVNGYNATRSGNTAQTAGGIGYGQSFDGTDDYFTATNVTKVGFGTIFSSSAWIYFPGSVTGPGALWSLSDGDANWEAQETQAMLGDRTLGTAQSGRYPEFVGNSRGWIQPTNALGADGWHYITYVYNSAGPVRQIYIDGTSETLTQTSYASGTDAGSTFIIGNKVSTDVNADFNGKMDELRIENVVRSADWIKLCYETQKPSPTVTITDMEAFRPCSLFTTATQCSVTTTGWTVVFDKAAGGSAGKYGGITILTDSSHGKTTGNPAAASNNVGASQNLFYVTYINGSTVTSLQPSSGGAWSADMLGNIAAHVQQTCTMNSLPFTIDYTIHGSGKMFIKVAVTNTGADIPRNKTLQFNLQRRVVTNTTVAVGNNTATLCPWVLVSCDSARHLDPMLVPFTLWNSDSGAATSATGLINTPASGLAGYECTTWGIGAGQRQTWEFMLDFSHKSWNDSNGVGAYAHSYRNPDSLEFLTGCPTLEQAWEEYLFGHWKLDETTGDSTFDNSGAGAHGVKTSAASWTTGKLGGGLALSGSSQKVTVTNRSNLGGAAGGITVMAWIKPSGALSTSTTIIGKLTGSTGYKFFGTATGGKLSFQADNTTISDTTTIGTGTWRHVAVTCNTILDSTKFYVDGRLAQISSGAYSITGNSADVLIGDGFAGTIDDVRYYGQALEESAVRAIWKLGYLPDKGMYDVRASNSNTVYLKIDGGTDKRRFPVFQIDNYWGTAAPNVGCVVDNGTVLVKDVNYFTYLNTIYRKLFIAFNKTVNADSTLIYVDDSSNTGARTVAGTRKMVWGSLTGVDKRQWFWCKNFAGDYFGAASANQFYFAWKMDSATGTAGKARAGELCRFKSSTQSPNSTSKIDTSTTNSLMSSESRVGGTPLGMVNVGLVGGGLVYGLTYPSIPTYTVVESSLVRIQIKLNERTLSNGTGSAKVTTRWSIYPTGQVFRWDSISYFSSALSNSWFGSSYQRFKSSPVSAIDKKRMRAVVSAADSIHDNVVAFLGFKNGNNSNVAYPWIKPTSGGSGYNDTVVCVADLATDRTGLEFNGDTATGGYWKQMPIQTAFYYDYQRDNITATDDDLYRDSVSNGVQCIGTGGGPALGMLAGTLVTNSTGDLNGDGFNEREGAYIVQATSNQACFILPARHDTCRFYPAFRITNYMASQKPQYVYCYHVPHGTNDTLALLEGYDYNMYLKTSSHELVLQIDSVFCDSTAFYLSPDRTLAVTLSKFNAAGGDACDTVKWRTESENENLGYYIYRRIKPAFFDSLSKAVNAPAGAADDTALDDAALLFKRKTIVSADTGWVLVNNQIVPGAPSGVSVGPRDYVHVDGRNVYNGMVYEYKVVAVDYNNKTGTYGPAEARPGRVLPVKFALSKIYPNPFRKITFIRFDLPVKTGVEMDIYNIQGKLIRRLLRPDKKYPAGFHKITWDGLNEQGQAVATGTYLCRFIAKKFVNTKVMIMLK